ncbi:GNAT family N-acetyltransferase [Clostridium massiliamazoniense]|uniref:GNAT family N-acetyltransferase n=1 Tax=Clostridium massiliamazoniense TaxID=1347366 RepID=UPI0006D861FB|nr:GNAT family N-acetyltransferase [Clostridium massiliamazoniense]
MSNIIFRESKESELNEIISNIKEFATYINGYDVTNIDIESLREAIFITKKVEYRFIEVDDEIVGYIMYFNIFSTFKGKLGIYLEDLYVKEKYRSKGIGSKVFDYLKVIAKENNYCMLEWNCLKSNIPAMEFYKEKIKAKEMDALTFFNMDM